jgi:hypothetical protein
LSFRTVPARSIADLVLACLVLAFEVMMLVGVAIGLDRLSGNLPSPDTRQDDLFATAAFSGMFVLYPPALVTLSAGGVGLMRRKRWGYYCHLAPAIWVVRPSGSMSTGGPSWMGLPKLYVLLSARRGFAVGG